MATILIIDDEAEVGNALRRVLERAGHTVGDRHDQRGRYFAVRA